MLKNKDKDCLKKLMKHFPRSGPKYPGVVGEFMEIFKLEIMAFTCFACILIALYSCQRKENNDFLLLSLSLIVGERSAVYAEFCKF